MPLGEALMPTPGCARCGYGATWMRQEPCWGFPGCHARGALQNRAPDWSAGCHCERCVSELAGYVAALAAWNAAHE